MAEQFVADKLKLSDAPKKLKSKVRQYFGFRDGSPPDKATCKLCFTDVAYPNTSATTQKTAPPPCGHAKNVTSRENDPPPPGGYAFLPILTIFKLNRHIQKAHVLTKFHEDWTKNVTSRVFTCFHYIHIEKTAPPPGGHVFSPILTIYELVPDINDINVLTKFHDDLHKLNTAPHPGGHVYQRTGTIFELNQHII
ncbi:hypothetical protein DPMN_016039 [Dreissena polymorpha]|uniref:Uncharacterized protein n=1 Tax=Dreissena polymorpha TaxID=45954 RepID=A0A9D4S469_DREPO|nr:hypothetical protein DPMN_016039 [Dreissena polymorpha]